MRIESQTLSMAHSPLWFTTNWPISPLLCIIIFTIGLYFLFTVKLVLSYYALPSTASMALDPILTPLPSTASMALDPILTPNHHNYVNIINLALTEGKVTY